MSWPSLWTVHIIWSISKFRALKIFIINSSNLFFVEIDYGVDMIDYSELNTARLLQMQKEAKKRAAELEAEENKKKKKRKKKRKKKKKLTQRIRDMKV